MRRYIFATLTLVLAALAGCNSKEAAAFNNSLAILQIKLVAADRQLEHALTAFVDGAVGSEANARAAYEDFCKTVAEVRKTFDGLTAPERKTAQELQAAFAEYLKLHEEAVAPYKAALAALEKHTTQETKRLHALVEETREKLSPLAKRLTDLQKEFVKEFGLKVKK